MFMISHIMSAEGIQKIQNSKTKDVISRNSDGYGSIYCGTTITVACEWIMV